MDGYGSADRGVCPNCGSARLYDAHFCHACGHSFPPTSNRRWIIPLAAAVALVLGLGTFFGVRALGSDRNEAGRGTPPTSSPVAAGSPSSGASTSASGPQTPMPVDLAKLFARVRTGVIRIDATTCDGGSVGTGFLVDDDLVATAAHVVDGSASLALSLGDEANPTMASGVVIGFDTSTDLALIRADRPLDGHVFDLADKEPEVGDEVLAIGFPKGDPMTLTRGIVSGLDREIKMESGTFGGLIQTDAAINPGNSGGPVIDVDGEVQGVADAVRRDAQGIAYAVPAETVRRHLEQWGSGTASKVNVQCEEPTPPDTTTALGLVPPAGDELSVSVTKFFTNYFTAINAGDYDSVWRFMGPKVRPSSPGKLADSLSSTMDFGIRINSVKATGGDTAVAHVTFVSIQSPEKGPKGNTCTVWNLDYTLRPGDGDWRIDKGVAHGGGSPWTPC